ncbi:uncharacterised conserved protein UCP033563, partial [Kipferlia bialata]|eukprot:g11539.t1
MRKYLADNVLVEHEGLVYLERVARGKLRRGVMVAVDLEEYDFSKGSTSLIRATEKTVPERLPPRVEIRKDAPLELPHIMVLMDDPTDSIVSALTAAAEKKTLTKLYDVELMEESGHVTGYALPDDLQRQTMAGIKALFDKEAYNARYNLTGEPKSQLIFGMGDGNHSLATAKYIWEDLKEKAQGFENVKNDRRRYALVELNNVHDEGIVFEPIHRVLFGMKTDFMAHLESTLEGVTTEEVPDLATLKAK